MGSSVVNNKGVPIFDGQNFQFWKARMNAYLLSMGLAVQKIVKDGYIKVEEDGSMAAADIKNLELDGKAINALYAALTQKELAKVINCKTAHDIWEKLRNIYEGDSKIKEAKLQLYRSKFEALSMSNDETIEDYFNRVIDIVSSMTGLGEKVEDSTVVKKILRSLPDRYDAKVSAIEERDLDFVSMDDLQSTLIAYEMRTSSKREQTTSSSKEAAFKTMKSLKIKENEPDVDDDDEFERAMAFISRNFKSKRGKYKGKLPLKCFNCGGIGHFAFKCPKKIEDENDDHSFKRAKKGFDSRSKEKTYSKANGNTSYRKRNYMSKKYKKISDSESDSYSSDIDDSEDEENLMVVKVNSSCEEEQSEEEIEGRINLKLELEGALNELSKQRKKAKRATAAMKDIQSIAERFEDEKIVLEEKVHQLEQELGKLQSEATNLQNSEDILSMINVEKEMLEQENKILLEKVEELTFKLEEQVKINDDMATELVAKAKQVETLEQNAKNKMKTFLETSFVSPCGESSNMSNDEARNESSMKLKKCIEMQRPHSMGKQGLGFEENIIPLMDENSGKTKVVHPTFDICDSNTTKEENREVQQKINGNQSLKFQFGRHGSFMRFNGYCFSCGKYGHRAIVCRNKNRSQVGSYPFLRQFGNWFGYNYQTEEDGEINFFSM